MKKDVVTICSNDKIICSGLTDERTNDWLSEIGSEFVSTSERILDDAGVQHKTCSSFQDWNDGYHNKRGGKVAGEA